HHACGHRHLHRVGAGPPPPSGDAVMWASIWARLQGWLLMAGAALLVLAGAYAAGGRAARRSAELDSARKTLDMKRRADRVGQDIGALDAGAVLRRAGCWVRAAGR